MIEISFWFCSNINNKDQLLVSKELTYLKFSSENIKRDLINSMKQGSIIMYRVFWCLPTPVLHKVPAYFLLGKSLLKLKIKSTF